MSESLPADLAEELRRSDRGAYFEQRIFVLSPFGTAATAALIFVLFAGAYLLLAWLGGVPFLVAGGATPTLGNTTRTALTLSLMMMVILVTQRFVRMRQRRDIVPMARVLKGGLSQAVELSKLSPNGARLMFASLLGAAVGAVFSYFLYFSHVSHLDAAFGVRAWFSVITILMAMTFVRGVELTRMGSKSTVEVIENELMIDLLRTDELSVWGRNAARFALIWFIISAVTCLLFVSREITVFTVALLIGCLAMGFAAFIGLMLRIHYKIVRTKEAELERLRREIDAVRSRIATDTDAAICMQGLLAYEARIAEAQEWPFDQTTLVRVIASAFILAVPWFGQAVAAFTVERLADFAR